MNEGSSFDPETMKRETRHEGHSNDNFEELYRNTQKAVRVFMGHNPQQLRLSTQLRPSQKAASLASMMFDHS